MKIIIASDKFKNSLGSMQACQAMAAGVQKFDKNMVVELFPMADGGDGFANVLKHYLHSQTIECNSFDALMRPLASIYEWIPATYTAIIEMATASGIALLKKEERNPLKTSSYGTGCMIQHAIGYGARQIILGVGGSATSDAGAGILSGLGFRFEDAEGKPLIPSGEALVQLAHIIPPAAMPAVHFTIACDVQNTLYGKDGAAYVFAPQKGADENAVDLLDKGLRNFAAVVVENNGKDIAHFKGAGAAGGATAGICAFFDAGIVSGAAMVIEASAVKKSLVDTTLILTGEGRLDSQTSNGKVVQQIAALGNEYNVPVVAICGDITISPEEVTSMGLSDAVKIGNENTTREQAIANAPALLQKAAAAVMKRYCKT